MDKCSWFLIGFMCGGLVGIFIHAVITNTL